MKQMHTIRFGIIVLVPFLLLILGFEIGPLLTMIVQSFQNEGGQSFSFEQYMTIFTSKYYLKALQNSLQISLVSSVIGIIVAAVAAYSITKLSRQTQERILMFSNMTSNFAGVPLAFAYIVLLGNSGLFTLLFHNLGLDVFGGFDLYSWTGLTLVYVYFQIPLAIMLLYPVYHGIRDDWKEASSLLGASSFSFWRYIGIPVILPSLAGTFSILFANAMGAYATAYALVGSNYNLVPIRIGGLISGDVMQRMELGSALAVVLALTMVIAMLVNEQLMRRVRRDLQ